MPLAGHALWAEVGGGITFVTSGENTSKSIKLPVCIMGVFWDFFKVEAIYASLSGTAQSPWLWFIGMRGHFGEIAGKNNIRPLFLLFGFFSLVEILLKKFWCFIL